MFLIVYSNRLPLMTPFCFICFILSNINLEALSHCLVNVKLLPDSRQLNTLLCETLFLTCQGIYICKQNFKTEHRTYLNLHFAVLFASRNAWYADLHTTPSLHSAWSLLQPKSALMGVQATPEPEVDFYFYTAHTWSCATTICYVRPTEDKLMQLVHSNSCKHT